MTGSSSPCGACKFLRRKCVRGCVFAPYFSHEQGAPHFAAIHRVFGASNVSKLLAHLPATHRCEAALTISYEAQARVQDPIYGCVSHIFALQQQVVNLQAQLACLRGQQASSQNMLINNSSSDVMRNPSSDQLFGKLPSYQAQDVHSWLLQQGNSNNSFAELNPNLANHGGDAGTNAFVDQNFVGNYYENSGSSAGDGNNNGSFSSYEEPCYSMASLDDDEMQRNPREWAAYYRGDTDDLSTLIRRR